MNTKEIAHRQLNGERRRIYMPDKRFPDKYPPINWWRGALRPFESRSSLSARFHALNEISFHQFEISIEEKKKNLNLARDAYFNSITSVLNEDIDVVRSVFGDLMNFDSCKEYGYMESNPFESISLYCTECSKYGYHSWLHTIPWLAKCPFHLIPLRAIGFYLPERRMDDYSLNAMQQLMRKNCHSWPRPSEADSEVFRYVKNSKHLSALISWAKSAHNSSKILSAKKIWVSEEFDFRGENSYKNSMGRLRYLNRIPDLIKPLFETIGEEWDLTIQNFPIEIKNELNRFEDIRHFDHIFSNYKFVSAYSNNPPSFIKTLRDAQKILKNRHGKCRCEWGWEKAGWSSHWIRVDPRDWPHWCKVCPYQRAIEMLENEWGTPSAESISHQAKQKLWDQYVIQSRYLHNLGLITYASNARVSPMGYLVGWYSDIHSSSEWVASSITEFLYTVAQFEIDVALIKMLKWLDGIESGNEPTNYDLPAGCVRLCETDNSLALIKWSLK